MSYLLDEIFETSRVTDSTGKYYELHSHTSRAQCLFIDEIIRETRPTTSLEVGLAYGISTLQILKSMADIRSDFTHIVMDPFQNEWNNIGLLNIERCGLKDHVRFYPELSTVALPRLDSEKNRIQFAYVDSTKVFDLLMVDVHYITSMMDIGGVLVLDDCDFPGIRLLARFLSKHPSYQVLRGFSAEHPTMKGRIAEGIGEAWLKMMPFRGRKFSRIEIASDAQLDVAYKCIAFKKMLNDVRSWKWYESF